MSWAKVKLESVLKQYRIEHSVQNDKEYRQVTISKHDGVRFRGFKKGYEIGRKRQFLINLNKYPHTLMFVRQGVDDGAIGIAPEEVDGCIATENMPMFSIENIEWEYLNFVIKSSYFKSEIVKIPTTGSAQKSIHERQLLQIEIPLPPSPIQIKITDALKKVELNHESLLSEISFQLDLLKRLRQQILQDAVQGKLVPQGTNDEPASKLLERIKVEKEKQVREKKIKKEKSLLEIKPDEIPFDIPENWVWCRLGEIAYIASGSTPKQEAFVRNGIPYLKMYNLRNQKIDFNYKQQYIKEEIHNGQLKRSRTQIGDLLMNIVGPPLGKLAIIPDSLPQANFNQAAVLIRPFHLKELNNWIFWYLNEMSEIKSIVTKGVAGQDNISVTQSKNIKISLPPLPEQHRIIKKVEQLMKLCDDLEQTIQQNQKYTEDLLQVALKEALELKGV